jgi:hypothetical protein
VRRALVALAIVLAACKGQHAKRKKPLPSAARADAGAPALPVSELRLVGCQAAPPPPSLPTPGMEKSLPTVTLGTLTAKGPIPQAKLAATFALHHHRLQYCYEQRLVKQPSLAETIQLTITVESTGHVFEAMTDKGHDEQLALCLKHIISEAMFPEAPGGKTDRTRVTQAMTFAWHPPAVTPHGAPKAWTPFAASPPAPAQVADGAAAMFPPALSLSKLDACLGTNKGSFRSVVTIGTDGAVTAARTGGLADQAAEDCVSKALVGTKSQPVPQAAEVACDFQRGDATPWRISTGAGYTVLEPGATRTGEPTDGEKTFLILLDRTTPSGDIEKLLAMAQAGAASIVALRADSGAPVYVGAGPVPATIADPTMPIVLDTNAPITMCGGLLDEKLTGGLSQADAMIERAAQRCTFRPCPSTFVVSTSGPQTALDLGAVAGAARGLDFQRIVLGPATCPR